MSRAISLLLEQVKKREEAARLQYQKALSDRAVCQKNLDAINNYREIYTGELNKAGADGMTNSTLVQYNNFINRLDKASEDQVTNLRKADDIIAQRLKEYQDLQTRRKGLEKLLENEELLRQEKEAKAEQKLTDESALHSFMRSRSDF
ncbi:MAG: flagellar export protein FliJ [Succinivibrionaceae bacterium]